MPEAATVALERVEWKDLNPRKGLRPREMAKVKGRGTRPFRYHYATRNRNGVVMLTLYGPFLRSGKQPAATAAFITVEPARVTRWP